MGQKTADRSADSVQKRLLRGDGTAVPRLRRSRIVGEISCPGLRRICGRRGGLEGGGEGEDVAGACAVEGDAGEETVEVEDALEGAAEFFAADEVGAGGIDGCVAGFDRGGVDHGPQQRGAEHALAHGGAAGVHGAEEGDVGAGIGEQGLDELEIAGGDLIEVEALGAGVEAEGVDVTASVCWVVRT